MIAFSTLVERELLEGELLRPILKEDLVFGVEPLVPSVDELSVRCAQEDDELLPWDLGFPEGLEGEARRAQLLHLETC